MKDLKELVTGRKSVRTYDGRPLRPEDRQKLEDYAKTIENPFAVPVEFVFLDAGEYGLSSPVLSGEQLYVAGKVPRVAHAEEAYGYSFEELVLYAWSLGIGTVWIGGTMKRELFEQAAQVSPDEMMPCISPLGYPAGKRSLKEVMMRKAVRADDRKKAAELFFENNWDTPMSRETINQAGEALEMVRLAPSAVNKQPWRILYRDGLYHFYEKKDRGYVNPSTGDLQRIDVGIALCHFIRSLKEQGRQPQILQSDPGIASASDLLYVVSVEA